MAKELGEKTVFGILIHQIAMVDDSVNKVKDHFLFQGILTTGLATASTK